MIVKKHITQDKRLILAVCDKELLGRCFEESSLQLDLRGEFYNGEEKDTESAPQHRDNDLMETFTLINMENITHKVTLSPKKLTFHDIDKSAVVIMFLILYLLIQAIH